MNEIGQSEYYRNCCHIPHWFCSLLICVFFFVLGISVFIISLLYPNILSRVYEVGDLKSLQICCAVASGIILFANCIFAYGIIKDFPLFILTWIIIALIEWKLHIIVLICTVVYLDLHKRPNETFDYCAVTFLFILQIIWIVFIVMVARHWYAICEELYTLEYGIQPGRFNRRLYTMSNRSRTQSHFSQRLPQLLSRIER